ncbi:MAG: hypothetical protein A2Y80_01520 [Deltaproteobacteria bacterium RBG_13_58_19]|nr:MAG: hypothetical protein A2Y80_01520 [Deltaproteobacteria bacterium RBG_13_58_19]
MHRMAKGLIVVVLACSLYSCSLIMTVFGGMSDAYKLNLGDSLRHTRLISWLNTLGDYPHNFSSLISAWMPTEPMPVLIPVLPPSIAGDTFMAPGDYRSQFTVGKKGRPEFVVDGLYQTNPVTPSTYTGGLMAANPAGGETTATRKDPSPYGLGYVVARDYGVPGKATIEAALAAIGVLPRTLVLTPGDWQINAALTIPSNVNLKIEQGAYLCPADGVTVTIGGGFEAGNYQVIKWTGTGRVVFREGTVREAFPQWWGAYPGAPAARNTAAIAKMFADTITSTYPIKITFPTGKYEISDELTVTAREGFVLEGGGMATLWQRTDGKGVLKLDRCEKWKITGFNLVSESATGKVLYLLRSHRGHLSNLYLRGCQYGLYCEGSLLNRYENISGPGNIMAGLFRSLPLQSYGIYMTRHMASATDCTYSNIINPIIEGCAQDGIYIEYGYAIQILGGASEGHGMGIPNKRGLYLKNSTQCQIIGLDIEACGDGITPTFLIEGNYNPSTKANHSVSAVSSVYMKLVDVQDCVITASRSTYVFVDSACKYNTFINYTWNTSGGPATGKFTDNSSSTMWILSHQSNGGAYETSKFRFQGSIAGKSVNYGVSQGNVSIKAEWGNIATIELTENVTSISLGTPIQAGQILTMMFIQDATGGRTVTGWAPRIRWAGHSFTPTPTASRRSSVTLFWDGSAWNEIARSMDVY